MKNELEEVHQQIAEGGLVYAVARDVTDRKHTEEDTSKLHTELKTIFDNIPLGIVYLDADFKFIRVNKFMCQLAGVEEKDLVGKKCYETLGEYADSTRKGLEKICSFCKKEECFSTKRPTVIERPLGDSIIKVTTVPQLGKDGVISHFLEIVEDITEDKRNQEELVKREHSYRTLSENLPGIVYRLFLRENNRMHFFNNMVQPMTGFTAEELTVGDLCSFDSLIFSEDKNHVITVVKDAIIENQPFRVEYRLNNKEGDIRHFIERGKPIMGADGKPLYIDGVIFDITDIKQAEEQIKQSLKEKEILLREVHHRVKNNMQIISSLLRLQSRYVTDETYRGMFEESYNRVISMSLVHEQIYNSGDLTKINIRDYIIELTDNVFLSNRGNAGKIALNLNVDNIQMGLDVTVPFGLILNELLTNSLKHAFPDGRNGKLTVSLHKTDSDDIELIVSDNGVGIPEDIDIQKTNSLGLHLINLLAENQLRGEISLNRNTGTEFRIKFKEF